MPGVPGAPGASAPPGAAPRGTPRPPARGGRPRSASPRAALSRLPWPSALAAALVTGYVTVFVLASAHTSYDTWGALLILPALMAVSTPVLARIAAANPERNVFRLLLLAMAAKLLCSFPRYLMAFVLYGGAADAKMYHRKGTELAAYLDQADLFAGIHYDLGMKVAGTGFVVILTGVVYAVTGPSLIGGFLVFSWLGFWGLLLFWRALQIAFPEADTRKYAKLVFFLPSLLFWPSSIGKDAWMMFCLGLTTYGTARLLDRRFGAFACIVLGSLGTAMVRPHVTALAGAGLMVAYVLRRRPRQVSALGPLRTILTAVVLGAMAVLVLQQVSAFFGTDGTGGDAVNQVLSETSRRTSQGNSMINATAPEDAAPEFGLNPAGLPVAVISVLFRPFPFEASNVQNLIQSVECFALLVMFIRAWPRLSRVPRLFVQRSYVAFAAVYTLLFCWAFSTINNMGILSRERVQVLPMALVLLVVPATAATRGAVASRRPPPVWRVSPGQWGARRAAPAAVPAAPPSASRPPRSAHPPAGSAAVPPPEPPPSTPPAPPPAPPPAAPPAAPPGRRQSPPARPSPSQGGSPAP
ncbi:hypothetical protein [Kitasatospora sp. NBC_00458]|uniref:hypothetical protein n=1 Tax=Kitasatospora sp. NBC_00458 TaxID=2903568 RepID=UPI002E185D47